VGFGAGGHAKTILSRGAIPKNKEKGVRWNILGKL